MERKEKEERKKFRIKGKKKIKRIRQQEILFFLGWGGRRRGR